MARNGCPKTEEAQWWFALAPLYRAPSLRCPSGTGTVHVLRIGMRGRQPNRCPNFHPKFFVFLMAKTTPSARWPRLQSPIRGRADRAFFCFTKSVRPHIGRGGKSGGSKTGGFKSRRSTSRRGPDGGLREPLPAILRFGVLSHMPGVGPLNHTPGVYHKPPVGPDFLGLPVSRFFFSPRVFSEDGPSREEQPAAC